MTVSHIFSILYIIMSNKLISYLKSSRAELKKVTWPSRQETTEKTILVIVISIVVAIYLGALDYILTRMLELVI